MSAENIAAPADHARERSTNGGAVSARGITKWFTRGKVQTQALSAVDLDIEPGEFVSVIGASGCGKSTLLRIIGGLLPCDTGEVSVAGRTAAAARNSKLIGFAPQAPALLPWRSVRRNVQLLGEINSRRAAHPPLDEQQTLELLTTVGLADFLDRWPNELSGGMQQRTSLVRCFVLGAPVLLMDEPFSALDEITRDEMRYLLLDLWERTGSTVVFVTHSIPEAVLLSDRVLLMAPRPGRVVLDHRIDLPRPRRVEIEDDARFHQHVSTVRTALREVSVR